MPKLVLCCAAADKKLKGREIRTMRRTFAGDAPHSMRYGDWNADTERPTTPERSRYRRGRGTTVRFNIWLVVVFALLPIFVLFVGMGVAGGFRSPDEWEVTALIAAAIGVAVALAWRGAEEPRP
jgi:hypothetical protein